MIVSSYRFSMETCKRLHPTFYASLHPSIKYSIGTSHFSTRYLKNPSPDLTGAHLTFLLVLRQTLPKVLVFVGTDFVANERL